MPRLLSCITLVLSMSLTHSVVANESATRANGEKLQGMKTTLLNMADQKIEVFNNFKTCVNNASTKKSLKACRTTKKVRLKEIRKEHKKIIKQHPQLAS